MQLDWITDMLSQKAFEIQVSTAMLFGFFGSGFGQLGVTGSGAGGAPPSGEDLPHFTVMFF